jgi:hypothetical protein
MILGELKQAIKKLNEIQDCYHLRDLIEGQIKKFFQEVFEDLSKRTKRDENEVNTNISVNILAEYLNLPLLITKRISKNFICIKNEI